MTSVQRATRVQLIIDEYDSPQPFNSSMDAMDMLLELIECVRPVTPTGFFDPEGVHIGDRVPEGILLAYGEYNDDFQAALILVQPLPEYRPDDPDQTTTPANYCVCLMDDKGEHSEATYFWNLHDASNYMQENLGQDR